MAAPVIQSSATATDLTSGHTSLTIAKPSGLAVGDIMVAVIGYFRISGTYTGTGWTRPVNQVNGSSAIVILHKVADAGDVAASDFTFNTSDADGSYGILYRIDGQSSTVPISASDGANLSGDTSTPTFTIDVSPQTTDALFIVGLSAKPTSTTTVDTYTISGTNPTWTEQFETYDSGGDHLFASATAQVPSVENRTSLAFGLSISDGSPYTAGIIVIAADTDVTATPDSISLRAQQSAPTPMADVSINPSSIPLTLGQSAPTTRNNNNPWTEQSKNSTAWTEQDKS